MGCGQSSAKKKLAKKEQIVSEVVLRLNAYEHLNAELLLLEEQMAVTAA